MIPIVMVLGGVGLAVLFVGGGFYWNRSQATFLESRALSPCSQCTSIRSFEHVEYGTCDGVAALAGDLVFVCLTPGQRTNASPARLRSAREDGKVVLADAGGSTTVRDARTVAGRACLVRTR